MPEMPFAEPPEQAPKKRGMEFALFGKKKEEASPYSYNIQSQINELSRRVRLLESRHTDLNRKIEVNEKNLLDEKRRLTREIKAIDSDILELKKSVEEIRSKMDIILSELENFSSKSDLESLRKYIELWEPLNFVTREEVERIVKESLEEKGK